MFFRAFLQGQRKVCAVLDIDKTKSLSKSGKWNHKKQNLRSKHFLFWCFLRFCILKCYFYCFRFSDFVISFATAGVDRKLQNQKKRKQQKLNFKIQNRKKHQNKNVLSMFFFYNFIFPTQISKASHGTRPQDANNSADSYQCQQWIVRVHHHAEKLFSIFQ